MIELHMKKFKKNRIKKLKLYEYNILKKEYFNKLFKIYI